MEASMSNLFDQEMNRLRGEAQPVGSTAAKGSERDGLARLEAELKASIEAENADVGSDLEQDKNTLAISLKGQPLGVWKVEGGNFALYRAGSGLAECQATSVAEAAKMTARLVAVPGTRRRLSIDPSLRLA
jgi:hypothetical protein